MDVMTVGLLITILLLFHPISSSIQQSDSSDKFRSPDEILSADGWLYFAKTASWYKAIDHGLPFGEAEANCAKRSGHLVSIHSQEENVFVQEIAEVLHPLQGFWIGLERNPWDDTLVWTDESTVDFTNLRGVGWPDWGNQAELWVGDGKWGLWFGTSSRGFICKRSSQFR